MRHVCRAGLVPVARNWRCRHGEIDLIARDADTLVFIEVRMRRGAGRFGGAAESITLAKRSRLMASARLFMSRMRDCPCRFDVMLMNEADEAHIEWIRDAFGE